MGARSRRNKQQDKPVRRTSTSSAKSTGSNRSRNNSEHDPQMGNSQPTNNKALINAPKKSKGSPIKASSAGPWAPSPGTALKALISARLSSAIWSNITDCDETFNYWEPMHFLIHGNGFQTWEYSPLYAIRSYAYLWLYGAPTLLYSQIQQSNKVLVFYFTRCVMALVCALCESYMYRGISKALGPITARLFLFFQIFATGLFISSSAFLPSSFAMYCTCLIFGAWLQNHHRVVILSGALSTLVGWPFSALIAAPFAGERLAHRKPRYHFIEWTIIIGLFVATPLIAIDSYYYGKLVLAPLNIVLYNVFSDHGPELYGTEPVTFYFFNLFLNFNLVVIASLSSPLILILCRIAIRTKKCPVTIQHGIIVATMFVWLAVFILQPHKEERFMFPIYPLISLTAAICIDILCRAVSHFLTSVGNILQMTIVSFCVVFALLSVSRGLALYQGYHAPMDIYMELGSIHHEQNLAQKSDLEIMEWQKSTFGGTTHRGDIAVNPRITVCVGKEWYRFPSSFFLPDSNLWELAFIQSDFRGQLPKPFETSELPHATRLVPSDMNDMNFEEPSRYVALDKCHYIVDTDLDAPDESSHEVNFSQDSSHWRILASQPFLDARHSPPLLRAFYVPFISSYHCQYVQYNLLQRIAS